MSYVLNQPTGLFPYVNQHPDAIINFFGGMKFSFLHPFFPCKLVLPDYTRRRDKLHLYPSLEHYVQAMKAPSKKEWEQVVSITEPEEVRRYGAMLQKNDRVRISWKGVRLDVMRRGVEAKFPPDEPLARKLLQTNDACLVYGNTVNETFWGRHLTQMNLNGIGTNWLGILLMSQRAYLKAYNIQETKYQQTSPINVVSTKERVRVGA